MRFRNSGRADATANSTMVPHRSWGNWLLLAGSFIVTTTGLGLIIATLLPNRLVSPWPWVRTDIALLVACLFLVLTLVLHLSAEQRHITRLHEQYATFRDAVHETTRRRLYALLEVSRAMGLQGDPQAVFDCITRSCVETFDCNQASLMLYDETMRKLVVRSASGHEDVSRVLGQTQAIGEGIAGWVALHQKPIIIGREGAFAEQPELKLSHRYLTAAIVVPIILRDELVGVINISSRSEAVTYDEDDMRALTVFAENAGACIRNAERAQWMRATIESLRAQLGRENPSLSP